jgi:2-polyprenyl-6-methoxyphenol hydroxylase-like FAD-dependent oxidoreductase
MTEAVAIAGAGPVGLMLACELRLHGVETVVLERLPEPRAQSWGSALNSATVEVLDQREVMEAIRTDGFEWPMAYFAGFSLDPGKLTERHNSTFIVSQANVERRLEEHAVKIGADVRRGHEITGVDQDDTGVAVSVRTATGDYRMPCRYLVGCDGSASAVRQAAGIKFPGVDAPFHGLVGDLAVEPDDDLFQRVGAHQHDRGPFLLAQVGERALRIALGEFGAEPPPAEPALAELRALAERVSGRPLSSGHPLWLARWYNVTRQAERYRAGSVFLAGDAAHVHFPLSGLALNAGIEDAVNLGWKLAADLHGWAPAGLLDSYHAERHPVGAAACLATQAQVALMHPMDTVAPLREIFRELLELPEVNEHLVRLTGGLKVRYTPAGPAHPLTGCRLVNAPLTTADGETTVARTLYAGRGVLLDLSAGALPVPDVASWTDRIDVVIAAPVEEIPARQVLLRPDGRVAWAAPPGTGLPEALAAWFGTSEDAR